jgi:phosphatidylinositol-3-phosphatase
MRRLAAVFVLVMLVAACGRDNPPADVPASRTPSSAPSVTPSAPSVTPSMGVGATPKASAPDHVVVVVFENKAFEHQVGNHGAPYLNKLLAESAVFTRSYAVTHPSQPNYLALFSGSTQGVTSDACLKRFHGVPNLGSQLIEAGRTFAGYSEGLPYAGYRGCYQGRYAAKHNPWVDFDNVPDAANQPYSAMPTDYAQLPTLSFVIPDLCNDMHDCGTAAGDTWAKANLDPYLRWATNHNSLLLITYDEDDNSAGNHILTIFAGAGVRPGQYAQRINHYSVLRTLEEMYGLQPLGHAKTATAMTGFRR